MEDNRKHIDEFFRETLADYTEMPAAGSWKELKKKMPGSGKNGNGMHGNGMHWWHIPIIASVASILYFSIHNFISKDDQSVISATSTKMVTAANKPEINERIQSDTAKNNAPVRASENIQISQLKKVTTESITNAAANIQAASPVTARHHSPDSLINNSTGTITDHNAHTDNSLVAAKTKHTIITKPRKIKTNSAAIATNNTVAQHTASVQVSTPLTSNLAVAKTKHTIKNKHRNKAADNIASFADSAVPRHSPIEQHKENRLRKPHLLSKKTDTSITGGTNYKKSATGQQQSFSKHPIDNKPDTGRVIKKLVKNKAGKYQARATSTKPGKVKKTDSSNHSIAQKQKNKGLETATTLSLNKHTSSKKNTQQHYTGKRKQPDQKTHIDSAALSAPQHSVSDIYSAKLNALPAADINTKTQPHKANADTAASARPLLPLPFINNDSAKIKKDSAGSVPAKMKKPFPIEVGIKGGFETAFSSYVARKYVVAPYLQYNLSSRLSVMLQPAIKSARVNNTAIGTPQSYYNIVHSEFDSTITVKTHSPWDSFSVDSVSRRYYYKQRHDSIYISHKVGGTFIDFELPILVKYKLTNTLSLYGGVTIDYSKIVGIETDSIVSKNILREDSITYATVPSTATPPLPPDINGRFSYSALPLSAYTAIPYTNPAGNKEQIRLGLMLGATYTLRDRFLFDLLVEQNLSGTSAIPNSSIGSIYSQLYFRISIGYLLFSNERKK